MIYSVFGLGLSLNQPLGSLDGLASGERVDVEITLGSMPPWRDEMMKSSAAVWAVRDDPGSADAPPLLTIWTLGREHIRLLYGDGVDFLLDRSGAHIWVTWPEELTADDVSSYLLGPILGFVLRLRGITGLHASGVVIDGRAALFVGASGAGKSTTAAAFLARGHRVLADDVTPVVWENDTWFVRPGYPRLRLWPTAIRQAGFADKLAPSWPADRRHHLNLIEDGDRFQREPLPLGAVYVLSPRSDAPSAPFIGTVEPADAMMALVGNTFANTLLDSAARAHEFDEVSRVAAEVPIRGVTAHSDASRLDALCDLILDDFRSRVPAPAFTRAK